MRSSRIALLALLLVFGLAAPEQAADESPATQAKAVLFFDDFSGSELDRTKWNVEISGPVHNDELQCYIDSPDTTYLVASDKAPGSENGALVIHPHYRAGTRSTLDRSYDFVSARLNTKGKFDFTHGTCAARIRMPDAVGVWPAFWLLGNGDWPASGEIDIMEYVGEKDWTGVAVHGPKYSGETPIVNKFVFEPGTDVTDWHVYSVDWTPKEILFRIDGRLTYRATRAMIEHFGKWVFDEPQHMLLNFAVGGIYPFKTNGIRKPFYGLPESTTQRIKDGEIKMEVDWVKVTKN
jgi:beta-glucanase (GH16 family)